MYKNLKSTYDYFDYNKLLDRDILPSTIQKSSNKVLTIDRHYKNFNSGIITRYCEHREDETKHLLYSNVNWNDIIYLDIKPITFTITSYWDPFYPSNKGKIVFRKSNFGEHVLNKVLSNPQKFYLIHYTSDHPHRSDWNKYFFDYFNKMKEPQFLIYLEYIIQDDIEITEFENCMNTEYFTSVGFNSPLPIENVRQSPQGFSLNKSKCSDYPRDLLCLLGGRNN